ncbi:hypothetical protein EUGRSUZ_G02029 [Eucalyptus grandis]|uniref:Uncharacterized protein n=2 Tax=Eucalyptus grandis TaxID=71139 RepID=A0ACC3K4W9_EUCGR|nr:hypothetical protein EUGRSUZ_G02029 [Eucalyptus grandis]
MAFTACMHMVNHCVTTGHTGFASQMQATHYEMLRPEASCDRAFFSRAWVGRCLLVLPTSSSRGISASDWGRDL